MKRVYVVCLLLIPMMASLSGCVNQEELDKRLEDLSLRPVKKTEVTSEESTEVIQVIAEEITATPVPTAEPVSVTGIVITAAGDCSLGNYEGQDYSYSFNQTFDKNGAAYFLENVQEYFANDDYTVVNLEGTLTTALEPAPERTYNIKGDPSYVDILTLGSVESVSMANNHRWDFGAQGSKDTVDAVKAADIRYAYNEFVSVYETKGITIGHISINELNGYDQAMKFAKRGFEELKEAGADLILCSVHWGIEREFYPTDSQMSMGRELIDLGADLVIGHHPHVIQGIEMYQGKAIIYSLANFSFGANRNPVDKDTFIFRQEFVFVDGEKTQEAPITIIPCTVSSMKERNDYRPTPAEGEDKERIIQRLNEYSKDFGVTISEEGVLSHEGNLF